MKGMIKTFLIAFLILGFVVVGKFIDLIVFDRFLRAKFKIPFLQRTSRLALKILGIKVDHQRAKSVVAELIVCNHLSYVDILIISSKYPAIFVTSEEVNEDPLLGLITRAAGCLFVERRHPFRLPQEISEIEEYLSKGVSVMFFPEGTTTDGTKILKFKSSLFQSARFLPQVRVIPLCLSYLKVNGRALDGEAANKIFYYGEMTFGQQLKHLLSLTTIETAIERLPEQVVEDRKHVARTTNRLIADRYFDRLDAGRLSPA